MVQNDGGLKSKPNSTKQISCEIQVGMGCHQQIPNNIFSYFELLFHIVIITLKKIFLYIKINLYLFREKLLIIIIT
jgi:hypothetical protein